MSNVFNEIKLERAFEGYLESLDYLNDLNEAAEKWITKSKENTQFAEQLFFDKLAEYNLTPILLSEPNDIIEDVLNDVLLWIGEEKCAEDVQERFMEEPCYDY
jgi:hypothetical protein